MKSRIRWSGAAVEAPVDPDEGCAPSIIATGGWETVDWLCPSEMFFVPRTHDDDAFQMPYENLGAGSMFVIADGSAVMVDDMLVGYDLTHEPEVERLLADTPRSLELVVVRQLERVTPELVTTLETLVARAGSVVLVGSFDEGVDLGLLGRGRLAVDLFGVHLGFYDTVDVAGLVAFENLQAVSLRGGAVTGLGALVRHPELRSLALEVDEIADADLDRLAAARGLQRLLLAGAGIDALVLERVGRMSGLRHLAVRRASLEDSDLAHLAGLGELRTLALDGAGVGDAGVAHLAGLTRLRSLSLGNTAVGDEGLGALAGLGELRAINLALTAVGDDGIAALAGLTHLEYVNLNQTSVGDEGLDRLDGLERLTFLDVIGTNVSPERLETFLREHPDCRVPSY
jgi:hypothetical protein